MDKLDPKCPCTHHAVAPFAIVVIGVLFLLNAFQLILPSFLAVTWPILLIFAGLAKIAGKQCGCCGCG